MAAFFLGFAFGGMACVFYLEVKEHLNGKWKCHKCGTELGERFDEYA